MPCCKNREELVKCIACEEEFTKGDTDAYVPLEYFDDACICRECLTAVADIEPVDVKAKIS